MGKVFKGIKKIWKKVVKVSKFIVKKNIKFVKKYGKYIVAAAAIYFTAGAAMALFAPTAGFAAAMPGISTFTSAIGITGSAAYQAAIGTAATGTVAATSVAAGGTMGAGTGASLFAPTATAGPGAMMAGATEMATAGGVASGASSLAGVTGGVTTGSSIVAAGMTGFQKAQIALTAISMGANMIGAATADKPYENQERSIYAEDYLQANSQQMGATAPQLPQRAPMPTAPMQSGFMDNMAQSRGTSFWQKYQDYLQKAPSPTRSIVG